MSRGTKAIAEIVQFIPVITLASSFIVKGAVDLEQAGALFVVSGIAAVIITVLVRIVNRPLNPILLATNLWLVVGAVAFGAPLSSLATLYRETNAVLLFAAVFGLGIGLTVFKPETGFIGARGLPRDTVRRYSLYLLGLSAVVLCVSIAFKDNIRLGGGLPFIVLNVTRRVMMRRASRENAIRNRS